jgi:hypothetical protein
MMKEFYFHGACWVFISNYYEGDAHERTEEEVFNSFEDTSFSGVSACKESLSVFSKALNFGGQENNLENQKTLFLLFIRLINKFEQHFPVDRLNLATSLLEGNFPSFVHQLQEEEKRDIFRQVELVIAASNNRIEEKVGNYSKGLVPYIRSISSEITPESEVVLAEFEQFIQEKNRGVLLYPSSHNDDSDIQFMNKKGSDLFNQQHQVFIHIDYDDEPGPYFQQGFQFEIVLPLIFGENAKLRISKVELKKKSIWILFFASCKNEEVLKELISNEIGIDTLFCKCDGITQGMGGPEGFRVETMFYGCFFRALHLKRIITEYGTEFYLNRQRVENNYAETIQWVQENFEERISRPALEIMGPQPKMTEIIPRLGIEYSIEEETRHIIQSNNPMFLIDIVRN